MLTFSFFPQVFAVVVGCLSSITCIAYLVPFVFHALGFIAPIWNLVLFILHITLFGVFAKVRAASSFLSFLNRCDKRKKKPPRQDVC